MKLFARNEPVEQIKLSLENNLSHLLNADVIAREAFGDFLYSIKDSFSTSFNYITSKYVDDTIMLDIQSNKFEVQHVVKRLNFGKNSHALVSKPEYFKGYFTDYTLDLVSTGKDAVDHVITSLDKLKFHVSYFINEYKEDQIDIVTSNKYFKDLVPLTDKHIGNIRKYFKGTSATKVYIKDVIRNFNDITSIYQNLDTLDRTVNQTTMNQITQLSKGCEELIDILIENNIKANGKLVNDSIKKDIVAAIYAVAKEVESVGFIYGSMVTFYGTFKSNTEVLLGLTE